MLFDEKWTESKTKKIKDGRLSEANRGRNFLPLEVSWVEGYGVGRRSLCWIYRALIAMKHVQYKG